jgi:hypothetical protein
MYNCQNCGVTVPPRTTENKIITRTRPVSYPERRNKENEVIDRGGIGHQIVTEITVCETCRKTFEG